MAVVLVVTRVRTVSIIRLSCVSIRIVPVSECHPRSARSTATSRLFSHSPSRGGVWFMDTPSMCLALWRIQAVVVPGLPPSLSAASRRT